MKHESPIGSTATRSPRTCTTIFAAVLLAAMAAGGCSSSVSTEPQPADDAKPVASVDASTNAVPTAKVETPDTPATAATENTARGLPRLLDLGAGKCIPCKMMAPILDELKGTVRGRVRGRVYRRVGEAGRS